MKKTSKVSADLKKNRLHVVLVGALNKKNMERIFTEIRLAQSTTWPERRNR